METNNVRKALVIYATEGGDGQRKIVELAKSLTACATTVTESRIDNLPTEGPFEAIIAEEPSFTTAQLEQLLKLLSPNCYMYIAKSAATAKNLSFQLKVGGFVAVSESDSLIAVRKPDYEVGSSVKVVDTSSNGKKKLWSVEAMDDLEADDLINDEELLDEADRAKPSAEELRVCATTKQRKACANCSCGLAQELEAEEKEKIRENSQNAKSSCGSCYLGDAFRCASCPYRGMPAFKPGEKVVIDASDDL